MTDLLGRPRRHERGRVLQGLRKRRKRRKNHNITVQLKKMCLLLMNIR